MVAKLGPLELQALTYAQLRGSNRLQSGDLVRALRWSALQENKVLSRLARKQLVARLRRGLYLVPPALPPGGIWSPSAFLVLHSLMADAQARYQITGPNAFYRYGWTEQVPNRYYAYNDRLSGDRQIGAVALTLIKVNESRLGGTQSVATPEGFEIFYSSRARALVDAIHDHARFNTLPRAYDWIRQELTRDDAFAAELVEATLAFANQGTLRRIAATLERADAPEGLLRRLHRACSSGSAPIAHLPSGPRRGPINKRWNIILNEETS
jgi:predicted transcriptional regulator of viral defense system